MPDYTVQISITHDGHTEAHSVTGNTREWLSDKAREALFHLLARVPWDEGDEGKPEVIVLPKEAEKPTRPCPPEGEATQAGGTIRPDDRAWCGRLYWFSG
jgi:hypothetical protein